tara:strand:+ start:27 stop:710 length:684 start_codon:yes stop_codon:yes gene_type:complete
MALTIFVSLKPVSAGSGQQKFSIYITGLKIGELTYAVNTKGTNYAVRGIIKATGLVGAIAKYNLDATAFGRVRKGNYRTQKYTETSDNGKRISTKKMIYKNGIPNLTYSEPLKDYWAKPSEQKGTVDPITAIMALLADQPLETECRLAMDIYDGARRFSIKLSEKIASDDKLSCKGNYKKIDGYSKKEWSQGDGFSFELKFVLKDGIYKVDRLVMSTKRGRTSFIRR